jgi:hypothetical protein
MHAMKTTEVEEANQSPGSSSEQEWQPGTLDEWENSSEESWQPVDEEFIDGNEVATQKKKVSRVEKLAVVLTRYEIFCEKADQPLSKKELEFFKQRETDIKLKELLPFAFILLKAIGSPDVVAIVVAYIGVDEVIELLKEWEGDQRGMTIIITITISIAITIFREQNSLKVND